jgi:methanethiol S-methyltransferase
VNDLSILALSWLLWCALHSLLILPSWVSLMHRLLGARMAAYRLAYVLFSAASLVPVLLFQQGIDTPVLMNPGGWWIVPRIFGLAGALLFFFLGAREYDQLFFFGLRQLRAGGADTEFTGFSTHGILGRVRHPYYSGSILLLLCVGDITPVWLVTRAILIAYLLAGTVWEERKLLARYGEAYARYRATVPMLVPRLSGSGTSTRE